MPINQRARSFAWDSNNVSFAAHAERKRSIGYAKFNRFNISNFRQLAIYDSTDNVENLRSHAIVNLVFHQ